MPTRRITIRRWPPATRRGVVIALVVTVLVTACSPPGDRVADAPTAPVTEAAPSTAAPGDDPTTSGAPATDCGDDLTALDAVIIEQLAAFAADDWDHAFSLTSRRFRAGGIDADRLQEIVTSGYAEAAEAERHAVLGCVRTGREAQVLIEVTATDGATLDLVYLMTREDGRWRVSGAVEHPTGGSEPATIPA